MTEDYDDEGAGTSGNSGRLKWAILAALLAAIFFFLLRTCSTWQAAPVIEPKVDATAGAKAESEAAAPQEEAAEESPVAEEAKPAAPADSGMVQGERDGKPMLTVYFDTGKSAVTDDLADAVAKVKDYLAKNKGAKLAVSGFHDSSGGAARNAVISRRRAEAVGKVLEKAGVPTRSILMVKPKAVTEASGDDANARRVEVTVQ